MAFSIDKYLTHLVDIVKVTMAAGLRSTTTVEDVAARITSRMRIIRDAGGDRFVSATIVWFKPDQDIDGQDEVVVDGKTRPVAEIVKARGRSGVHHLEVELT